LPLFIYTNKGSFLLKIYKLNLSATEQLWIFLAFFLAYAIKIHLFLSILGKQCTKAPAVGTMLLSGIMLKWIVYIIHANAYHSTSMPKSTCTSSLQFRTVIYGSILALRQKDSKEVTRLLLISPRYWLIAAGDYLPHHLWMWCCT
jgi:NADH-quinone oxidoreductase subunit M